MVAVGDAGMERRPLYPRLECQLVGCVGDKGLAGASQPLEVWELPGLAELIKQRRTQLVELDLDRSARQHTPGVRRESKHTRVILLAHLSRRCSPYKRSHSLIVFSSKESATAT